MQFTKLQFSDGVRESADRRAWVSFSAAFQVTIPDCEDTYFLSPASVDISVQKLASAFNKTAIFSAPKEK